MSRPCDVVIIGAGPYGLSLAAHLRTLGVDFRIFGRPLDTWRSHMPSRMFLKSEGFASNLSAPSSASTLKSYCDQHGIAYADRALPIPLDTFLDYGDWFCRRFVPELEDVLVTSLEKSDEGFVVDLESGEQVLARHVVLAVGVSCFAYTPPVLASLPNGVVSHSYHHRTVEQYRDRNVVVVGAGSSAIDLAWQLHDEGASVRIVARTDRLAFNSTPSPDTDSFLNRLQNPPSPIGQGWKSYFCASAPLMFYRLPQHLKRRAIQSHLHAAGGWFMREKVEGNISATLGRELVSAAPHGEGVILDLKGPSGERETLSCDHVIAATGYRADMRRLPFLSPVLRAQISPDGGSPIVSDMFETQIDGLFAVGMATMECFGPLLRFMVGAEFVAPRLAGHLQRICGAAATAQAA